ncbi:MAG: hypothetical protein ABSG76_03340, partial [Xanthobacteraceae bacterium]
MSCGSFMGGRSGKGRRAAPLWREGGRRAKAGLVIDSRCGAYDGEFGREFNAMGVVGDPELERLLATLHARSDEQAPAMRKYYAERATSSATEDEVKAFRSDKLVALDRDKAEFCYQLCRATNARRIVEVGTS